MKSLQELAEIRNRMKNKVALREESGEIRIVVGMATCGIAAGARPVLNAFVEEVERQGLAGTSALVMNCGLPDQQLCPTLHEYQGQTGYFATLLVGKPKQGAN